MSEETIILGAGMTGLAAGLASDAPIFDAADGPGGICRSYYLLPGNRVAQTEAEHEQAYRFENGGGHWIFGGDPAVLNFIERHVEVDRYSRKSSVFFPDTGTYVPYPLQNNLRHLPEATRVAALAEMTQAPVPGRTMKDWLASSFGPTLGELFFEPFHRLYTAGLYDRIAPQDGYKSPVDIPNALAGAFAAPDSVGYNTTYFYPSKGLDHLAGIMAEKCNVQYHKEVTRIDASEHRVHFSDNTSVDYGRLLSTLPLHKMLALSDTHIDAPADPHTAVLVLNIGAVRGDRCPDDHWLYLPSTKSGFHRVGFYSNVTPTFLPSASRDKGDRVSIYIERGFIEGAKPNAQESKHYADQVVQELQEWGFIGEAEVVDPTWIDVAYTWSWPNSSWRQQAMQALEAQDIFPTGRYARWIFQGIADSLRDGFIAGSALKSVNQG